MSFRKRVWAIVVATIALAAFVNCGTPAPTDLESAGVSTTEDGSPEDTDDDEDATTTTTRPDGAIETVDTDDTGDDDTSAGASTSTTQALRNEPAVGDVDGDGVDESGAISENDSPRPTDRAATVQSRMACYGTSPTLQVTFNSPAEGGAPAALTMSISGQMTAPRVTTTAARAGTLRFTVPIPGPGRTLTVARLQVDGESYTTDFGSYTTPSEQHAGCPAAATTTAAPTTTTPAGSGSGGDGNGDDGGSTTSTTEDLPPPADDDDGGAGSPGGGAGG